MIKKSAIMKFKVNTKAVNKKKWLKFKTIQKKIIKKSLQK